MLFFYKSKPGLKNILSHWNFDFNLILTILQLHFTFNYNSISTLTSTQYGCDIKATQPSIAAVCKQDLPEALFN